MGFYCAGCASQYNETKRLLALIDNPWTKVEDGMPKVGVAVFVWRPNRLYPVVGFRQRKTKYQDAWRVNGINDGTVTHWAPMLPNPEVAR